jgi:hypothetical protein
MASRPRESRCGTATQVPGQIPNGHPVSRTPKSSRRRRRPLLPCPGPAQGSGRTGPFLEDCMRTEPAIFAIYVQCSTQSFDSPCNLRTSHSVQRAIFALPVARCGAIVRDGSSSAIILMVPAVGLGRTLNALARSWEGEPHGEPWRNPARTEPRPPGITQSCLDRNGPGTAPLNYKARSSQGRGIGFRFVPYQKEVL